MAIFGWDLSHFDAPDSRPAITEGIQFFTHKAGGDADDAEVTAWWNLMSPFRDRVLLGAYWVLYPGTPVTRADAFLARLDAQCAGWRDGPFLLQVDCEIWKGNTATQPARAEIRAFCDRLTAKVPKLRPVVYAPRWAYHDTLTGLGYPLWASNYVAATGRPAAIYPGDTADNWAAYSGQTPVILQFSSRATIGGQTTSDANAFRGTLDQLTALVAPGWETDMAAMTPDDAVLLARTLLGYPLGNGTPTVGVALQSGAYNNTNSLITQMGTLAAKFDAFVAAEMQRDAAENAAIAGLTSLVQSLTAATGALTPEQLQNALDQVKVAAGDAAATAVAKVEVELQSLRHHLGDDDPQPATGRAQVPTSGLPVYDEADAFTRQQREARQPGPGKS